MSENPSEEDTADAGNDWASLWRRSLLHGSSLDPWQTLAATVLAADGHSDDELMARLRADADLWQRQWRAQLPADRDVARALHGLLELRHLSTPWLAAFAPAPHSAWPRLGLLQNEQARIEALHQAVGAYREALLRHGDQLASLLEHSLADFEAALTATDVLHHDGEALFALWSETASARYERTLAEEPFSRGLAELTNAWSAVRAHTQKVLDPLLENLGLPSARGVTDTQSHLDRLRREHRAELKRLSARIARLEAGDGAP